MSSSLPEQDDRALLAAHVAGDPEAFGILFARHRDRLWAVALRTTGDREEAADALQDAMIAAFRRAGSYRGDAAVTTWLHRVVVNACLDRLRRRKVRLAEALPDEPEDLVGAAHLTPVEDPAEAAVRSDRRSQVLAALARLPDEQRAALVLVDMQGYSVEETASMLGVAPGTVKSRCSRGRARLAPLLEEHRSRTAPAVTPASSGNPAGAPHVPPSAVSPARAAAPGEPPTNQQALSPGGGEQP